MDPETRDSAPALVAIGKIVGARGLRGEVKITAFTERPENIAAYGPLQNADGTRWFELQVCGRAKKLVVARIDGVSDRNEAESLTGVTLYLRRDALPDPDEDEYYQADLVGLMAEQTDGTAVGRVLAVHDFGAGEIVEVENGDGESVMIPFNRSFVPEVDLAGGRLVIVLPQALLASPEGTGNGD